MLGFSISKVLFTVIIVAAVIYGWKWMNRVQLRQREEARRFREEERRPRPAVEAVDMTRCRTCGDYVPAKGAKSCGRSDCPYPG